MLHVNEVLAAGSTIVDSFHFLQPKDVSCMQLKLSDIFVMDSCAYCPVCAVNILMAIILLLIMNFFS